MHVLRKWVNPDYYLRDMYKEFTFYTCGRRVLWLLWGRSVRVTVGEECWGYCGEGVLGLLWGRSVGVTVGEECWGYCGR